MEVKPWREGNLWKVPGCGGRSEDPKLALPGARSGCEQTRKDLQTEANFPPATQGPKPAETNDNKNVKQNGRSGSKKLSIFKNLSLMSWR